MKATIGSLIFSLSLLATSLWADPPKLTYGAGGRIEDTRARRSLALQFDGWAGYLPRHSELKLGAALVLEDGDRTRVEAQIGENVIGLGFGLKLPLHLATNVLQVSFGPAIYWDVARHEWEGAVYLAHVAF